MTIVKRMIEEGARQVKTYTLEYAEVSPTNVGKWTEDGLLNYVVTRQLPEREAKALYAGWALSHNKMPQSHPRFDAHWGQFRLMLVEAGWTGGGAALAFVPPATPEFDADSVKLNSTVLAYAQNHRLSYAEAFDVVVRAKAMAETIRSYTQRRQ